MKNAQKWCFSEFFTDLLAVFVLVKVTEKVFRSNLERVEIVLKFAPENCVHSQISLIFSQQILFCSFQII